MTVILRCFLFLFPPPPQLSVLLPGIGELNSAYVSQEASADFSDFVIPLSFLAIFGDFHLKSDDFRAAKFREISSLLDFELVLRFLDRN